jgi:hypothetical protein
MLLLSLLSLDGGALYTPPDSSVVDAPMECQVSSEELIQTKKDYFQVKKEADKHVTNLALLALLSAICKVVVSLLRLAMPFFRSEKSSNAIRFVTLGIGVFVFLFSHLAAGESVLDSIILGACGPFSVVVHEYSKLFSKGGTGDKPITEGQDKGADGSTPV